MQRTAAIVIFLMLTPTLFAAPILLARRYVFHQNPDAVVHRYGISGVRSYYARASAIGSGETDYSTECRVLRRSPFGPDFVP